MVGPHGEEVTGPLEIVGVGDLAVERFARHDDDAAARLLDEGGVVGGLTSRGVSRPQYGRPERLGGLHRDQRRPVGGGEHPAVGVDDLDRVGDRHPGDRGVGARHHRLDDPLVELWGGQRPGRVVHADHVGVGRHGTQPGAHAGAAGATARDGGLAGGVDGGHHDHHSVRHTGGDAPRPVDHPLVTEQLVLLGASVALAGSSAHHHGPHLLGATHRTEGSTVSHDMTHHIDR